MYSCRQVSVNAKNLLSVLVASLIVTACNSTSAPRHDASPEPQALSVSSATHLGPDTATPEQLAWIVGDWKAIETQDNDPNSLSVELTPRRVVRRAFETIAFDIKETSETASCLVDAVSTDFRIHERDDDAYHPEKDEYTLAIESVVSRFDLISYEKNSFNCAELVARKNADLANGHNTAFVTFWITHQPGGDGFFGDASGIALLRGSGMPQGLPAQISKSDLSTDHAIKLQEEGPVSLQHLWCSGKVKTGRSCELPITVSIERDKDSSALGLAVHAYGNCVDLGWVDWALYSNGASVQGGEIFKQLDSNKPAAQVGSMGEDSLSYRGFSITRSGNNDFNISWKDASGFGEDANGSCSAPTRPSRPAELQPHDCGLSETNIDDRISDCSKYSGSSVTTKSGVVFKLVSRKLDSDRTCFYEVWQDSKTGLVWGDKLDGSYTFADVIALQKNNPQSHPCTIDPSQTTMNCPVLSEKACSSEEGQRANNGIIEKAFGIPTLQEFIQAEQDGIREVLPNMKDSHSKTGRHEFWSSTVDSKADGLAWVFGGNYGRTSDFFEHFDASVRCVGR